MSNQVMMCAPNRHDAAASLFAFNAGKTIVFLGCLILTSCTVTEPTDQDTARVRSMIDLSVTLHPADAADELGISQAAVIAAMPESLRVSLPVDELDQLFDELSQWGQVQLEFRIDPAVAGIYAGEPPSRITRESDTNKLVLRSPDKSFYLRLNTTEVGWAWVVRLPWKLSPGQSEMLGVYFYDESGDPIFQFIVPWDRIEQRHDPEALKGFEALWERVKR